jgi:hypothetical protein
MRSPAHCILIPFPLAKRIGKVRDVAGKMLATRTERQADHYRRQISEAMIYKLRKISSPDDVIAHQLAAFWHQVELEMARLSHGSHKGGAA